jgi:hypothetical protein
MFGVFDKQYDLEDDGLPLQVDGKEHPVTGSKLLNSILLSKVDNPTSEATMKHGDIVIASERRESIDLDTKRTPNRVARFHRPQGRYL